MNFVKISEKTTTTTKTGKTRDTWCVTSEVEYFDWLRKQPVIQVPSTERTIIYSKVVVQCGCHSFPKRVKNLVLYCTISLNICTRYLDIAMHYLDVTKGVV